MFAKIATVIVVLGAMYGALLVNRQHIIDNAAEISRIHFRMKKYERATVRLQAEVASSVRPDRLRDRLAEVAKAAGIEFKPIPFRYDPASAPMPSTRELDGLVLGGNDTRPTLAIGR